MSVSSEPLAFQFQQLMPTLPPVLPSTHAPSLWSLNHFTHGLLFPSLVLVLPLQYLSVIVLWVRSNRKLSYNSKHLVFCPIPFFNCVGLFSSIWTLLWPNLITHFFQVDLTQRLCPTSVCFSSNNSTKIGNKGIYKIFLDRAHSDMSYSPF